MRRKLLILLSCNVLTVAFSFPNIARAQTAPGIQWQKCYGGLDDDYAQTACATSDGGFVLGGVTWSTDGNFSSNHGAGNKSDGWLSKLSATGDVQWLKCYGGTNSEAISAVLTTADTGYIFLASASSANNGNVSGWHGATDAWLVKLDTAGNIKWQKCLGGLYDDGLLSMKQTADGGYILAGVTSSDDGDVSGIHLQGIATDAWVVKVSATGSIEWQKCLGGFGNDAANDIIQTSDGSYIMIGQTASTDGDVTGNHGGQADLWVVKLSSSGSLVWQRCYGGTGLDAGRAILQTTGGYIIVGTSDSPNGDNTARIGNNNDDWVLKIDDVGAIVWQKNYGFTFYGGSFSIINKTIDGNYILTGAKANDFGVRKISSTGNTIWQKVLGGTQGDIAFHVQQATDGAYAIAGYTWSNDGDVSGIHGTGHADGWFVKLNKDLSSVGQLDPQEGISISPNPTNGNITIAGIDKVNIEVYNTTGALLKTAIATNMISIAEYPAGLYFVKLSNKEGDVVYTSRIFKQ